MSALVWISKIIAVPLAAGAKRCTKYSVILCSTLHLAGWHIPPRLHARAFWAFSVAVGPFRLRFDYGADGSTLASGLLHGCKRASIQLLWSSFEL